MSALEDFKTFDIDDGAVNLWTFRKSQRQGSTTPTYTGRWVGITPPLEDALKEAITAARNQITETIEYEILAQNNEGSALTLTTLETHAGLIVDAAGDELPTKKARTLKHLQNTLFYTVKIVSNGKTLHAVSRANDSWKSKRAKGLLSVVFSDYELELEDSPAFSLSKYFDFFILENHVLITNKGHFESVLSYKQAHLVEFVSLKEEKDFSDIFTDMTEITNFVGSNKIQLRRAFAIRQKGHYKDKEFMDALRIRHREAGLNINYDTSGKITPSQETCPDIFQALLDHRLMSRFSNKNYDVQSTSDA